jgi:hypothetical protein
MLSLERGRESKRQKNECKIILFEITCVKCRLLFSSTLKLHRKNLKLLSNRNFLQRFLTENKKKISLIFNSQILCKVLVV